MLTDYLRSQCDALQTEFARLDSETRTSTDAASPPDPRARYWRAQLIHSANQVDFYTNLTEGSWWVRLHLHVLGQTMRFIVAAQKAGQGDTGVLAITVYAETLAREPEGDRGDRQRLLDLAPSDSVTVTYADHADRRWREVTELVDRALAASVDRFALHLG